MNNTAPIEFVKAKPKRKLKVEITGPRPEGDYLTGLMMRRQGEEAIRKSMSRRPGCFAFVDLDNLKKVNDLKGHIFGDRVLKETGRILRENNRDAVICRLGGDEFLYYMPGATKEEANDEFTRLYETFNQSRENDEIFGMVNLSAGLCMCTQEDDYLDIYNKADKALYHVKRNGKAGFSFYSPVETEETETVNVDLKRLADGLTESGAYEGGMDVEYREFIRIYEYLNNLSKRHDHHFNLVMLTLSEKAKGEIFADKMEHAMACLDQAISNGVRNVDVYTRFSGMQYLLILMEAADNNIDMIIERIRKNFYNHYEERDIFVDYSVTSMPKEKSVDSTRLA